MINIEDVSTYDLIDYYIFTNICKCGDATYAYSLGRLQGGLITVLMKNSKAPDLLDKKEKEQVPKLIELFSNCNLDAKVFMLSKKELAEFMEIDYYTIKSNEQIRLMNDE